MTFGTGRQHSHLHPHPHPHSHSHAPSQPRERSREDNSSSGPFHLRRKSSVERTMAWRRPEGDTDASSKALNSPIKTKTKEEERADLERVQQEMEAKLAALPLEEKWADESIDDLCLGLSKSSFDPSKENKLSTTDLQPTFRDHCDRKPETPLSVQQPLEPVGEPQPDKPLDKTKPKEGMPPPKTQGQAVRSFNSRVRRPSRAEGEKTIVVKICLCLNSEDTPEIIPVRLPKRVELD